MPLLKAPYYNEKKTLYCLVLGKLKKKVDYCTKKGTKPHNSFFPVSVAGAHLPTDVAI